MMKDMGLKIFKLEISFKDLIFSSEKRFPAIWKSSSSRWQKSMSEVSNDGPRFLKNSQRSKNGSKIAQFVARYHNVNPVLKNRGTNKAIFVPFFDLWEFFENRGLTLESSDFDFCDLLDELFHVAEKHFFE